MNNVITLENERLTKMKKIFLMAFSTLMLIPMLLVSLAFSPTGQVLLSDISKVRQDKTPLAVLAGEGNLGRDFNILNLNESVSQKENNYIIELSPKEALATLAKLTLTVDKKTHIILQTDVFDGLGNVTRTRFIDIKTNVGLSNSFFHFSIPPGTEVIKMQESFA